MHHVKAEILKQDGKRRSGRGFSVDELKKASLNSVEARRIGLPVDLRRRTVHDENVECTKAYAAQEKTKIKPKAKPIEAAKKEKPKS